MVPSRLLLVVLGGLVFLRNTNRCFVHGWGFRCLLFRLGCWSIEWFLGEALVCAARIRDGHVAETGKSEVFDYDQEAEDTNILKDAIRFLKEQPSILPNLSKDGKNVEEWPSEALRYLGDNYNPLDRQFHFVQQLTEVPEKGSFN